MSRVLVLIGALLFFRAVLPRAARRSPTAITPYMNALDGMMSAQQVSSVLDEVTPYESWLVGHRAKIQSKIQHDRHPSRSVDIAEPAIAPATPRPRKSMRP